MAKKANKIGPLSPQKAWIGIASTGSSILKNETNFDPAK
jgi:hypothetical protein